MADRQSPKQRPAVKPKGKAKKTSSDGVVGTVKPSRSSVRKPVAGISLGTVILDRMMEDMKELVEAQQFQSVEEGNAFLRGVFATRDVPWLTGTSELADLPGISALGSTADAQDLIYEAWEAPTKRETVRLARKALKLSPDCADAYVILAAETARTPLVAKKLYEQGLAAAERALGPDAFVDDVGHFWGLVETRPYMRARFGLANTLRKLGDHAAAIEHLQELLRLNPEDNQGVRYVLLNWLLAEPDRGSDVRKLLQRYKDDASAEWAYGRPLHLFRMEGASKRATMSLRSAIADNPHVPAYLLGTRALPEFLPDSVGWGDDSEAMVYAAAAIPLWQGVPGAIEWLGETLAAV